MCATLRLGPQEPDYMVHLRSAFVALFDLYGADGYFDVTTTANVILSSQSHPPQYSLFYGQSFSTYDYAMSTPQIVSSLADVSNLRVRFGVEDFSNVFFASHSESNVTVDSLVSIVYIITRPLEDFQADQRVGNRPRQLW